MLNIKQINREKERYFVKQKIPVYILTGFLGSGKTTVLLNMLEHARKSGLKPGLLLNEAGSVNVERYLFQEENMIELLNGCICCSIKDDLVKACQFYLREETQIDILFIEGTGVSNPKDIVAAFHNRGLSHYFEINSIINVIDASKYLEYKSVFSSSKEIRELLKDQLEISTLVLLNKIDLLNGRKKEKVINHIRAQLNSNDQIVETTYGRANGEILLKNRYIEERQTKEVQGNHHHHANGQHLHSFQTIKLELWSYVEKEVLEKWLISLPDYIYRGKGIIQTKEKRLLQFQFSSRNVVFKEIDQFYHVTPCVILIGQDMNKQLIQNSFQENVYSR